MLFDDIDHSFLGAFDATESDFAYLNRSARPEVFKVRALLDCWLSEYPAGGQNDLVKRIRSSRKDTHVSAFFELMVHALLLRLGLTLPP